MYRMQSCITSIKSHPPPLTLVMALVIVMIMRTIKIAIFVFTFLVLPFVFFCNALAYAKAPLATPKPIAVDSYELFWPLVAGKVEGDSLYSLKILKEKIRGALIFSNLKKSEYNTLLSEKRLLEFEKLALVNKDYKNSQKTLDVLKGIHNQIADQLNDARGEGLDISSTSENTRLVFEKESSLLQSILVKIDDSQKERLMGVIENLSKITSNLK